jgi:hypothetical protein
MDRERIVGKSEVIQVEPISNDSSESKLVGSHTASAFVKKLVDGFPEGLFRFAGGVKWIS